MFAAQNTHRRQCFQLIYWPVTGGPSVNPLSAGDAVRLRRSSSVSSAQPQPGLRLWDLTFQSLLAWMRGQDLGCRSRMCSTMFELLGEQSDWTWEHWVLVSGYRWIDLGASVLSVLVVFSFLPNSWRKLIMFASEEYWWLLLCFLFLSNPRIVFSPGFGFVYRRAVVDRGGTSHKKTIIGTPAQI